MTIIKRVNLIRLMHDYYLERINLPVYVMSSMFVHGSGLWPSSNIREHARRIVSRQKSEHWQANTWVYLSILSMRTFSESFKQCLEISSIEFYVTDIRLYARKRSYLNSRCYFDATINFERSENLNLRRDIRDRNKNEMIRLSRSAILFTWRRRKMTCYKLVVAHNFIF